MKLIIKYKNIENEFENQASILIGNTPECDMYIRSLADNEVFWEARAEHSPRRHAGVNLYKTEASTPGRKKNGGPKAAEFFISRQKLRKPGLGTSFPFCLRMGNSSRARCGQKKRRGALAHATFFLPLGDYATGMSLFTFLEPIKA